MGFVLAISGSRTGARMGEHGGGGEHVPAPPTRRQQHNVRGEQGAYTQLSKVRHRPSRPDKNTYLGYTHKTASYKASSYQTSSCRTYRIQNVQYAYKTSIHQTSSYRTSRIQNEKLTAGVVDADDESFVGNVDKNFRKCDNQGLEGIRFEKSSYISIQQDF
jgi:hypothetical protein